MANKPRQSPQKKTRAKQSPEAIAEQRIAAARQSGAQELDLSGLRLTVLPESLGQLTQLQQLNVFNNQLTALPESLSQLTQLQQLYVSDNQLTALPESLSQLTQLQQLNVFNNQLTALPESLGQLTQLQQLNVFNNQLTALPESLSQLTQLQQLDVFNNQLTALPESLSQLTQLQQLNVSGNQLTVLPESLGQLTQLQQLNVSGNQLTVLPESLSQLTQLQQLDVFNNQLTALPESLSQLTQLQQLNVSGNQLTVLPESLGQLTQLQQLNVSDNQLTALPESLSQLTQLQQLNVSDNQLTALPESLSQLTQLQQLNVFNNQLIALPESLGQLTQLQQLNVFNNQLTALPESLSQLPQLQQLYVFNNQLTALPESLGQLTQLQQLYVFNNQLTALPESLSQLPQLQQLYVFNNQLTALPESLGQLTQLQQLFLHDNPGLGLPPEVLGPSWKDVLEDKGQPASPPGILTYYFNSRASRPLNEAKMILVGRGGAGKTSLVQRLVNTTFNLREQKTDGIAITPWQVQIRDDQVRLNIWDFGGQEIMHATHQFFLTKRSLYLLVLNAREGEQDANLEYWLRLIESFGGDSPVIVVINQIKQHQLNLNQRGLKEKFPIREFIETDCEANIGLDALQRAIERETDRLEHVRDPFPTSWFTVKDHLANLKENQENYVTYAQYQALCVEHAVTDSVGQDTLVKFLHDLGIVVNFHDDARLADTHVLNPEWVTNGIYKIINAETLAQSKTGELHLATVPTILDEKVYPRSMHRFLLDLMGKFELCYEFYSGNGEYLVPELLGKEEPDSQVFAGADALRFEYHYNILPEGLLPRFIVRSRVLNKDLPRWRTGALLAFEGNQALVKADVQDKKVSIAVIGNSAGRRRLLSVIRSDFEDIHRSITRLNVEEKVPVPHYPGIVVDYETLRVMEAEREQELPLVVNGKLVKLNVAALLNGVEEPPSRQRRTALDATKGTEAVRVVFSYSHKDEELRDQLETHLKLLQRQGTISTWHDRKIATGKEWKDAIDDNFRRADVILLLTSADFLASDYCYDIEMKSSLERHDKGEATVIPVILRTCQWQASLFGKLQALPKDGKPVMRWEDRDEAWNDVANGIKKVAEEIRQNQDATGRKRS